MKNELLLLRQEINGSTDTTKEKQKWALINQVKNEWKNFFASMNSFIYQDKKLKKLQDEWNHI